MAPCHAETEGDQGNVLEHNEDEQMNQDEDEQNWDELTEHAQHTTSFHPTIGCSL